MTPAIINRIRTRRPGTGQIDWTGVPRSFRGRVSAVVRNSHEAENLIRFFGHADWAPDRPVLLLMPDTPTLIGVDQERHPMTASLLRDQAMGLFERELVTLKRHDGGGMVMHERGGPLSAAAIRKQVPGALIRQRIEEQGGI